MDDLSKLDYERASRAEARIIRQFKTVTNPTMQEHEFRNTFLPMFVGGGDFMNIHAWRAVAGSLLNEVDVYAGDTYQFTVPPVQLDVISVISQRSETGTMSSTLSGALINAADDPTSRDAAHLVATQIDQAPNMVEDKREEYLQRWDAIFKRYGIDYQEVRAQVAKEKYGIDIVKEDIGDPSSKKRIGEEIEFDDDDDDISEY